MICKLCLKDKALIKKSHIIPDFMYKGIYDNNHKLLLTNLDDLKKEKLVPTGFYEKDILCIECDRDIIGKYESYASTAIYGDLSNRGLKISRNISPDGLEFIDIENIDYVKFKLFILSIVWRASISTLPFFKIISLGKHEENLRNMIFNGDAKNDSDYEVAMITMGETNEILRKVVVEPRRVKDSGNTFCSFLINGFFYFINISSYNKLDFIVKSKIKQDNTMSISILRGQVLTNFYDSFMGKKLRIRKKHFA
jgi:hypothetical protein